MIRTSVVLSVLLVAVYARTAYICNVRLPGFTEAEPSISLQGQSFNFIDIFNVISFDGYHGNTGDVEGRAAVKNDVSVGNGYSFGAVLTTSGPNAFSPHVPYSLVAGGDVSFGSGSVNPDGTGFPYPGQKEFMYIGGAFTGASYLSDDALFAQGSGNKDAEFDAALSYYKDLSDAFAAVTPNAQLTVLWTAATIVCDSANDAAITVNVQRSVFNSILSYNRDASCSNDATLTINIIGAGNVVFSGSNIQQFSSDRVLYNVLEANVRVTVGVMGSILAPRSNYASTGGVVEGIVIVANVASHIQFNLLRNCTPPVDAPNPPPAFDCPAWEGACDGFDLTLAGALYSFKDFNAISFGDFTSESGDVEGRLAVRGDAYLSTYSVGYELHTINGDDRSLPYSLVVGGDLSFVGGAVFPSGTGIPYLGAQENIAVGGNFDTSSDYLVAQVSTESGLDAQFAAALDCYTAISDNIANQPDNVAKNIQDSGAFLTCDSADNTYNYVSFTPEELAQFTYFSLLGCSNDAFWFINIRGSGDVIFSGDSFPAIPGGLVYNIIGSRNVHVGATSLNGHLLAPTSNLIQFGGVIRGKVVAGNVTNSLQINRENTCAEPTAVNFAVVTDGEITTEENGDQCFPVFNTAIILQIGEFILRNEDPESAFAQIISVRQQSVCAAPLIDSASDSASDFASDFASDVAETKRSERLQNYNFIGYVQRLSTDPKNVAASSDMDSSASTFGVAIVAMTIAALIL